MSDERAYWVALNTVAGIGPIRFQRLLERFGGARGAWEASDLELADADLEGRTIESLRSLRRRASPERMLARLTELGVRAVILLDEDYPANLRDVADPPPVLFVRGRLAAQDALAVALVGTRRATAYGRAVAERLAREVAAAGFTVVSGLAKGIDTVAHHAALEAGGRTLAVLANGLDRIYPPENGGLARQIIERDGGALVSEFAPGVPPDGVNFPRRNRIISGLSKATVIVEAGQKSGALITADFALEQGRDVFAVPGSILSLQSVGTNYLVKQGAIPVTSVDDILEAIGPPLGNADGLARAVPEMAPQEASVCSALAAEPRHIDELARGLGISAGSLAATLAVLELKGLARQVGSMLYTRA